MPNNNSVVRTMRKDINLLEKGEFFSDETKDKKKKSLQDIIDSKDIEKLEEYIKDAKKSNFKLKERNKTIDNEIEKITKSLREHEKKEADLSNRAFRKKRRRILKQRRVLEEKKININKKIKKTKKHIEKLEYFKDKIKNSSN